MQRLLDSLQTAVRNRNWNAALFIAMSIPDICGRIEWPELAGSGNARKRFTRWFEKCIGGCISTVLSADDFYLLRCALVHEGSSNFHGRSIGHVSFLAPRTDGTRGPHDVTLYRSMCLQVDIVCFAMCTAAREWLEGWSQDPAKRRDLELSMLYIEDNSATNPPSTPG